MKNVAAFYASKQAKPGFAKRQGPDRAGRTDLPRRHRRPRVPACAGCHSPTGAGIPAQYPRLAGQHADYTEAQLVAFRSGARAEQRTDERVAAKLNDANQGRGDYVAGLR